MTKHYETKEELEKDYIKDKLTYQEAFKILTEQLDYLYDDAALMLSRWED